MALSPAPKLAEGATNLVVAHLEANMAAALATVRTDRADALVSTEPPPSTSYFIYRSAKGYRPPAIFVISDYLDFKIMDLQANMVNGVVGMRISAVVEDRDQEKLTHKAWRYEAAMYLLLASQTLLSADGTLKLVVTVKRSDYSPHFTNGAKEGSIEAMFRKEVSLECDVSVFENY